MANDRRNKNRHGVLLLIILALLAMFGATAIAFVILTRSQKGGADAFHQEARDTENPEKLLNEAAAQVLRGTNHANSVIGPHSLLEDVYGNEPLNGRLLDGEGNEIFEAAIAIWHDLTDTDRVIATKPSLVAGGQIIEFTVRGTTEVVQRLPGRVLTFTGGSFAGISTRILTFRQAALSDGTLLTWPTTDSDVNYRDQPVWRIQVVADGLLPFGHDGRPGVPNYDDDNDDGDNNTATSADNPEEYAWPYPNPPYGNSDDLKPGTHSASGTPFIVNGTAFCGTGFGFNRSETNSPFLTQTVPLFGVNCELALLPRHSQIGDNTSGAIGGANEDYDAVDYQNMLLGSDALLIDTSVPADGTGDINIPSLHRPALANYWFHRMITDVPEVAALGSVDAKWKAILQPYGADYKPGGTGANADSISAAGAEKIIAMKRFFMMRPLPEDHPNFDGSNPASRTLPAPADYATRNWERIGPWDVDNDGDGIPDSIWVDIGLPVRSTPDGRLYKPLVAILCTDLDGRLNLNAHGCIAQTNRNHLLDNTQPSYYETITASTGYKFAGDFDEATVLRGQGYGPAEVNLGALFVPSTPLTAAASTQYQQLLFGVQGMDGRYGESHLLAGGQVPGPGRSSVNDPLSYNKLHNYPGNYLNSVPTSTNPAIAATALRACGSPFDLKGSLTFGLDLGGRMLFGAIVDPTVSAGGNPFAFGTTNHPYELDLSRKSGRRLLGTPGAVDNPFSVSELEAVLRPYDVDHSTLPRRLLELAPSLQSARRRVTTESWDLPSPNAILTSDLRNGPDIGELTNHRSHHVIDLLIARGVALANIPDLLPLELQAGLRMDLNRPFGNGLDDDIPAGAGNNPPAWPRNGVVDEPTEVDRAWQVLNGEPLSLLRLANNGSQELVNTICRLVEVDMDGDNDVDGDDQRFARELYARQLYVLVMLLMHENDSLPPYWTSSDERADFLAQWAVNVVDFRDRDSIMTRFRYDRNPFDGWTPGPEVWGMERPELLITETLAFHDRRTEDLAIPDKTTHEMDPAECDEDFDQRYQPQGSLFIELYNPAGPADSLSGEFSYDRANSQFDPGVRLNQRTPNGDAVWRLIIARTEEEAGTGYPKYPKDPDSTDPPATIERSIRFVEPTTAAADDGTRHYPSGWQDLAPLKPGRYAVIGTGDPIEGAEPDDRTRVTYLGLRSGMTKGDNQTRRIELKPHPDPEQNWVGIYKNRQDDDKDDLQLMSAYIQPPVAVVVDAVKKSDGTTESRRLSISEPLDGYDACEDPVNSWYNPIRDEPVDKTADFMWSELRTNDTHVNQRVVYLQRLANPLEPYNATTNPYRTVDSMPVDLTTFNGVTADPAGGDDDGGGGGASATFYTRERGDRDAQGENYLWAQEPLQKDSTDTSVRVNTPPATPNPSNHYFANEFAHSLGYLNRAYCFVTGTGYTNPRSAPAEYLGYPPGQSFPWLTWNNRPFASPQELLLVPTKRSSQVFKGFKAVTGTDNPYTNFDKSFPHLLNVFFTNNSGDPETAPQLYRLFEFVHVPSKFAATEIQGRVDLFDDGGHMFRPPFHSIPHYREPGRINLNTIYGDDVFRGLLNLPDLGAGGLWNDFVESRRGYTATPSQDMGALDNDLPTNFARPFRSHAGRHFVPINDLQTTVGNEINSTIFRAHPTTPTRPLFQYQPTTNEYSNMDRNPFFRYQLLQRLGNSVTTRSNVYAVWITVGFFEVEWVGTSSVHPDGYALGQELGSDTGEIKRHRAFYIIDRSIPVGFRRGEDLNSGNCVLLKRFIE